MVPSAYFLLSETYEIALGEISFYLHQLSKEIHGYCGAFVEEHRNTSQEALINGQKQGRVNHPSYEEIRVFIEQLTQYVLTSYQGMKFIINVAQPTQQAAGSLKKTEKHLVY